MSDPSFRPGDHLVVDFKWNGLSYTHHGIYAGQGDVIHYDKNHGVLRVSLSAFAHESAPRVKKYAQCDPLEIVLARAVSRLGEQNYHVLFNNCEDFVCFCKTGKARSEQVNQGLTGVGFAAASLAAGGPAAAICALLSFPFAPLVATSLGAGFLAGLTWGTAKTMWNRRNR